METIERSCAFCSAIGAKKRCAACKTSYYCNRKCQQKHWKKEHKQECVFQNKENNLRHAGGKTVRHISDRYNHVLPLDIYNRDKFVDYVMQRNSEIHPPIMKLIFEFVTGYFLQFERLIPDAIRAWSDNQSLAVRHPESIRPWQHVLDPLTGYLILAEKQYKNQINDREHSWNFGPSKDNFKKVIDIVKYVKNLQNFNYNFQKTDLYWLDQ
jgi:hypothetical protein